MCRVVAFILAKWGQRLKYSLQMWVCNSKSSCSTWEVSHRGKATFTKIFPILRTVLLPSTCIVTCLATWPQQATRVVTPSMLPQSLLTVIVELTSSASGTVMFPARTLKLSVTLASPVSKKTFKTKLELKC